MFNYTLSRFSGLFGPEATPINLQSEWDAEHVDRNAGNVREALFGFDYIIEVRWRNIFVADYEHDAIHPPWRVRKEFKEEYTYPFRELGEHSVILEMRGLYDERNIFVRNEFGTDGVFVGTNNKIDAMMITLTYS